MILTRTRLTVALALGRWSALRGYNPDMRRRVFTIAAALSALLFVVTGVLWPVSYFTDPETLCGGMR